MHFHAQHEQTNVHETPFLYVCKMHVQFCYSHLQKKSEKKYLNLI